MTYLSVLPNLNVLHFHVYLASCIRSLHSTWPAQDPRSCRRHNEPIRRGRQSLRRTSDRHTDRAVHRNRNHDFKLSAPCTTAQPALPHQGTEIERLGLAPIHCPNPSYTQQLNPVIARLSPRPSAAPRPADRPAPPATANSDTPGSIPGTDPPPLSASLHSPNLRRATPTAQSRPATAPGATAAFPICPPSASPSSSLRSCHTSAPPLHP